MSHLIITSVNKLTISCSVLVFVISTPIKININTCLLNYYCVKMNFFLSNLSEVLIEEIDQFQYIIKVFINDCYNILYIL